MKLLIAGLLAAMSVPCFATEGTARISSSNLTSIKLIQQDCKISDGPNSSYKILSATTLVKVMVGATEFVFETEASEARSNFDGVYDFYCKRFKDDTLQHSRELSLSLSRIQSGDIDQSTVDDKLVCKREAMFITFNANHKVTSQMIRSYAVKCPF